MRKNLVVWSSSAGAAGRAGVTVRPRRRVQRRPARRRRIRTGALVAVIGLIRFARIVRARRGLAFALTGALLVVAGNMLPSGVIFIAGMLVCLRGAAVMLGVCEPRRPGGGADFFGFG